MRVALHITGVVETQKAIASSVAAHVGAFHAAVFVVAGKLMSEVVPRVPVDTGELRDSAFVTRTMPVQAGFSAAHAIFAHEVGPGRKFLQRPFSASTSSTTSDVAREMRALVTSNTTLATARAQHPETPEPPPARRRKPPVRR